MCERIASSISALLISDLGFDIKYLVAGSINYRIELSVNTVELIRKHFYSIMVNGDGVSLKDSAL